MPGKAFVISIFFLVHALQTLGEPALSPAEIKAVYRQAISYFNSPQPTAFTDSMALNLFGKVIGEAENTHSTDKILFQAYIDKGVLLDVKSNFEAALEAYAGALRCFHRHPAWNDSLLFKVYIYAGPDYYHLDNFDSAYTLLNKAESLAGSHPGLHEQDRLYNALGALYYESGNYRQGLNYFNRALQLIRAERPGDNISIINFENNIGSCLYKLGAYRESLEIYRHLLRSGKFSSQLCLNMGKSYIGLSDYALALTFYRKADPRELPGVLNEMAYAQFLLGRFDSSLYFLDKWRLHVERARQTKLDAGINELYRAQVLMARGQQVDALNCLQQAVIIFSGTFKETDIHSNPSIFTGSFASYRLFDALSSKAHALETVYRQKRQPAYLLAAWQAYNSAIGLFRYIEKNYTTDDARLFLKKNNQDLYQNALITCLELDRLHPGGPYLEQAFIIAEKSKASLVTGNLNEMASRSIPGINPQLLQKERALKYKIARLELKNDPGQGNPVPQTTASQKSSLEIELSFIQKSMELNSLYYKQKFEDACPSVKDLQARLNTNQAIVSLFVSSQGLHVFILAEESFRYLFIDSMPALSRAIKEYTGLLNRTEPGRRFGNKTLESQLVRLLVKPLLAGLKGKDEWTIIPDDIFYLLPFESLPVTEDGLPLIETTTISYQLSAKFLAAPFSGKARYFNSYSVLSFAPFAGSGEWVNTRPLRFLDRLPGSGPETEGLPGMHFVSGNATKEHFLRELNRFPVVHLATHALSDPQNSQGSLICFYPRQKGPEEDCLFLPELYGMNMDSTDLVILSACESGKGEIVDNEGMISLSRGFMYAGCASTVNSLWKADDRSTEAILQKFHVYLEKGYSKSAALRAAKLDYIHGNALYTTPDYWAHLILVGDTDPVIDKKKGNKGWIWMIAGLIGTIVLFRISPYRLARRISMSRPLISLTRLLNK